MSHMDVNDKWTGSYVQHASFIHSYNSTVLNWFLSNIHTHIYTLIDASETNLGLVSPGYLARRYKRTEPTSWLVDGVL